MTASMSTGQPSERQGLGRILVWKLLGRFPNGIFQTVTGEKRTVVYAAEAAKTETSLFRAALWFATFGRSCRFNDALIFQRYACIFLPRSLVQRL